MQVRAGSSPVIRIKRETALGQFLLFTFQVKGLNRRIRALRKQFGELFSARMCEAGTEIRMDFGRRTPKELRSNYLSNPVF